MRTVKPRERNLPLYVMLSLEERKRLEAFAADVGRPLAWVTRDALSAYMDAAERDAGILARVRGRIDATDPARNTVGTTKERHRGRPTKKTRPDHAGAYAGDRKPPPKSDKPPCRT